MRLASLEIVSYAQRLAIAMRTSQGEVYRRRGLIVTARAVDGEMGIGEAAPLEEAELGPARRALEGAAAAVINERPSMTDWIANARALVSCKDASVQPPGLNPLLHTAAPASARCALETALLDLVSRREGVSLCGWLGGAAKRSLPINALVTDEAPVDVGRSTRRLAQQGFRTFKLKVGADCVATDRARVHAASEAAGEGAFLRLDANGAWSFEAALAALDGISAIAGLDYVEEPLAVADPLAIARLRATRRVRVALDESVSSNEDLRRFAAQGACDVVVAKLQRLGGPLPALALARVASHCGLRFVLTDSLETSIGRAAALHCAAAFVAPGEAVGLAGAFHLDADACGHDRPMVEVAGPGLGQRLRPLSLR